MQTNFHFQIKAANYAKNFVNIMSRRVPMLPRLTLDNKTNGLLRPMYRLNTFENLSVMLSAFVGNN